MEVLWFIPTSGDGRYIGTDNGKRQVNFNYTKQIAIAADDLGYDGALVPTGKTCEDAWVFASALAGYTQNLKFLVALRPGHVSPTLAARMSTSFDRISNGRLLINVVTGGDPVELAGDGLYLSHNERYAQTSEFLDVWKRVAAGEEVSYNGQYVNVTNASLLFEGVQKPHPPIYFGGSSDAAIDVAADHVDTYLTWGEPPQAVEKKIQEVRARAQAKGRTIRFGIRLHIIVRETEEEAWQEANRLISKIEPEKVAALQEVVARQDSVGQKRMSALHGGTTDSLEVSPNLWAGIGLARWGAATALVGSPEIILERLKEYAALGIESFVLSGYPHLEECHRVAELILPKLKALQAAVLTEEVNV